MSLRPSKALRNFLFEGGSLKHALQHCAIKIYTGAQPATAEAAPTGTLLCTVTDASAALTREVLPLGVVTLSAGTTTGDTVTTFTINSLEIKNTTTAWNTSLTLTAADVVTDINNNPRNQLFTASSVGAVITISGKPGIGALYNAKALAVGVGGSMVATITSTTFGSGTGGGTAGVYGVNGLKWGDSAAGVLSKVTTQTWSGVNAASGTAGWFRIEASVSDAGSLDSTESVIRLDGAISTSGADMNLSTTVFTSGATFTMSGGSITLPSA